MRRALSALLFLPVLLLVAALAAGDAAARPDRPVVHDIRIGDHGDKTRFVLEMTGTPDYRLVALDRPYRVAIDFPAMDWEAAAGAGPGVGLVRAHRHGPTEAGSLRVMIELRHPARVRNAFYLPEAPGVPVRFVLDLEPTDAAGFAMQMANPLAQQPVALVLAPPAAAAALPSTPSPAPAQVRTSPPVASLPPIPLVRPAPAAPPAAAAEAAPSAAAAIPTGAVPAAASDRPVAVPAMLQVPLPRPRPQVQPRPVRRVIAIDPGHGGLDPGATGVTGVREKTITLAVARRLRRELEATGRYRVILTRERDISLKLRDRVQRAREAGADLFISLHADSIEDPSIRGLSVYTLSSVASDREAELLAARENRADALAGVALDPEDDVMASILIDLAQRQTHNESNSFARLLVSQLRRHTALLNHSHREAGFAVLKAPDVPSVLVELGYLSNREDERRLTDTDHQQRLAGGLARAIDDYFAWLGNIRRS